MPSRSRRRVASIRRGGRGWCPPELKGFCTKLRYADEPTALAALESARREHEGTGKKMEKRAYLCPQCHNWHLTSQPKK